MNVTRRHSQSLAVSFLPDKHRRYHRLPLRPVACSLELSRAREGPSLEMPESLHVLRLQPLGAVHVPTPGEARGDVEANHFSHFFWWAQPKMAPVAAAIDPYICVEVYGGRFACATADRAKCRCGLH